MSDRQGIEIDYCPECRGVWLDRGELDKIIERSAVTMSAGDTQSYPERSEKREYRDDYHDSGYRHKKRKKESFLGDLFDF